MFDEFKRRVMGDFREPEISRSDIQKLGQLFVHRSLRYFERGTGPKMPLRFYEDLADEIIRVAHKYSDKDRTHSLKTTVAILVGPEVERVFENPRTFRDPRAAEEIRKKEEMLWQMMEHKMIEPKEITAIIDEMSEEPMPKKPTEAEEFTKALKKL